MSPSTSATFAAAANGFSFVMCREFATTLYPRFRNASTSPAPIPRDAPVRIAVFVVFAIRQIPLASVRRNSHSTLEGCACDDFHFLHLFLHLGRNSLPARASSVTNNPIASIDVPFCVELVAAGNN